MQNPCSTTIHRDKPRVLIFAVAYHEDSAFASVLARIPESMGAHQTEVLVIEESSRDKAFELSPHIPRAGRYPITVLRSSQNLGYGGSQKLGFQYAIRNGHDCVVLLHGDGKYAPESIPELLDPILNESADVVLGSRMLIPGAARKGGMPIFRFVGNKVLTFMQNRLLRSRLSEFHSGFRAYRVSSLERIPFHYNSETFCFDTEVLIQFMLSGFRIVEVPIPTYYGREIRSVNAVRYAMDVIRTTIVSRLQHLNVLYHRKFDAAHQGNRYYDLKLGYRSSHTMALDAVPHSARVLDIGCGPGFFAEELVRKKCIVSGMDQFPPVNSSLFKDFFPWEEGKAYPPINLRDYDSVLLLDIIEHLTQPEKFLNWLRQSAKSFDSRPAFIVTSGNIVFFPVRMQALLGNFNYGKRGILDLTHSRMYTFASLRSLFEECGFRVTQLRGIPAPWPKAFGLNPFTRQLVRLNDFLIHLSKGLFAYQIFLIATPTPTVDALLDNSIEGSKSEAGNLSSLSMQSGRPVSSIP